MLSMLIYWFFVCNDQNSNLNTSEQNTIHDNTETEFKNSAEQEIIKNINNTGDLHLYKNKNVADKANFAVCLLGATTSGNTDYIKYLMSCNGINNFNEIEACIRDIIVKNTIINNHLHILKYFVDIGANIKEFGNGWLITACENGHLEFVKYLVHNGVTDLTVSHYIAHRRGYFHVANYLESVGAIPLELK